MASVSSQRPILACLLESLPWNNPFQMSTYSSILAWRILWTEEPGGLQSMGSQRVGHDSVTNTFTQSIKLVWERWILQGYTGVMTLLNFEATNYKVYPIQNVFGEKKSKFKY